MTKEITELLIYLRTLSSSTMDQRVEWATAVEQLQEDLAKARSFHARAVAKVEAYERILDKGITVNVYQDGTQETIVCPNCAKPFLTKVWYAHWQAHHNWGESEDKVHETLKDMANGFSEIVGDKVEKPSHDIEMELIAKSIPIANRVANRDKSDNSEAGE